MGDIYSTKVLYIKLKSKKVLDENKTFVAWSSHSDCKADQNGVPPLSLGFAFCDCEPCVKHRLCSLMHSFSHSIYIISSLLYDTRRRLC